jgi:hypothetical protein
MSDNERQPGQAGEGVSKEDLSFERLRILMSYDHRDEVVPKDLAVAWGTNHQTVGALLGVAQNQSTNKEQLKLEHGYTDADFPDWWYRTPPEQEQPIGEQELPPGTATEIKDPNEPPEDLETTETPAPKNIIKEGHLESAGLGGGTGQSVGLGQESAQVTGGGAYTAEQVQLLARTGVTYDSVSSMWIKGTPQGRGQYAEVVNPDTVLIKARDEKNQANYMDNIAEATLNNLSMTTQAILKKVALNPSVFQCFQYVSNVRDPDTGAVLFNGDFGDYISWAVLWATDKFYGVQPSYMVDRPSEYTRMRKNRAAQAQRQPLMDPLGGGFDPRIISGQGHSPGQMYPNSNVIPSRIQCSRGKTSPRTVPFLI